MKRLIPVVAIVLGWAAAASAAPPGTLTTLRAIHALTNAEASQGVPVAFEATVGYSREYENLLFVQDGDVAIFVRPPTAAKFDPGDRILVQGATRQSFRPLIIGNSVTLLHHGAPLVPVPATFDELIRAQHDSLLVTVHAVVRAADLVVSPAAPRRNARLQMLTDGGHFEANLDCDDTNALKGLLDTEVEITGVAAGKFDDKMQQTGIVLYVSSLADVKVLKRAGASPWSLPITPMDQVLAVYHMRDLTPRVRVQGTITYYQPGSAIVLQDGIKSLWIETHTRDPLRIGDQAHASGFPDAHERRLTLNDSEIQDTNIFQPITPQPATWHQLGYWSSNSPDGHLYDLVSIEGQVETEVREASQDEYVLASDGRLFTAIYRHPPSTGQLPPMKQIPLGSKVRVSGICVIVEANAINPGEEVPFNILLRSFDDIAVVASPSLLSVRNLIVVADLLFVIVLAVGTRGWLIERRVRRQTAAMAYIERRRGRILEDINGTRPIVEIIDQITELVSFKLKGAPCWCQIVDGAQIGNRPPNLSAMRIVQHEILSRTGTPIGTLYTAFDSLAKPSANEPESLAMAAGLAALAIESRRLYSDLLHRSEFDLLTDIHNRFSIDKQLDTLVQEAQLKTHIFGLIYIDLDEFKQVNDLYGHHIGDLYLQEVAVRMKQQLRSVDTLARLGGDEFAVLVPEAHSRADAELIALRLERSFHEPFAVEEYMLHGSASIGIAIYPDDAITKDGLLSAADADMYRAKNSRRRFRHILAERPEPLPHS